MRFETVDDNRTDAIFAHIYRPLCPPSFVQIQVLLNLVFLQNISCHSHLVHLLVKLALREYTSMRKFYIIRHVIIIHIVSLLKVRWGRWGRWGRWKVNPCQPRFHRSLLNSWADILGLHSHEVQAKGHVCKI